MRYNSLILNHERKYLYAPGYCLSSKNRKKTTTHEAKAELYPAKLGEDAQVSLSTIKKIEHGEIGSFDSFIRIIRILGLLDIFNPMLEDEELSPNEYYRIVQEAKKKERKRALKAVSDNKTDNKEESEW